MYAKILVALDNSANSEIVFKQALDIAQAMSSEMLLLHGLTSEEEGSPLPLPRYAESIYWAPGTEVDLNTWHDSWQRYASESLDRLRRFSASANAAGVTAEFRQVAVAPGPAICKLAHDWSADLIVMGNRGRSGIAELLLGSVSNYVLHRAPCSVMVIKAAAMDHETVEPREAAMANTASG
jgi:nucleotide-binding universal stress UspA family protein